MNYKNLLPKILKNRNKYEAGFVAALSGSKGFYGAAKLSAFAALKTGAGIVKVISKDEIDNTFYEMINIVKNFSEKNEILQILNSADSIYIGPGIGRENDIFDLLRYIILKIENKLILDADALYFLSKNLDLIPKKAVLTPHKKEMLRLLNSEDENNLNERVQQFSKEKNVIIVLKGFETILFHPEKKELKFNLADPGLSTAGTGDVLTGMIASFAAQKMDLYDACILSIYIHSKASVLSAEKYTSYSMIASDLFEFIPEIFKELLK